MFVRIAVALALVATVTAQETGIFDAKADLDSQAAKLVALEAEVESTSAAMEMMAGSLGAATKSIQRVDELIKTVGGVTADLDAAKKDLTTKADGVEARSKKALEDNEKASKKSMDDFEKEIDDELKDIAKKSKATTDKAVADAKSTVADLTATLAKYGKCAETGKIFDGKACVQAKPEAASLIPKVYHRGWDNNDGRESGYVNNRWMRFKKENNVDKTLVRVTYYDNQRVHGHGGCYANWNVMFCNAGGGDCQECSDPGRCNMNKYASHQHGWWMNDHEPNTVECVCRRAGGRTLNKGTYQVRTMINRNNCDIYTGHHSQFGSFIISEAIVKNSL